MALAIGVGLPLEFVKNNLPDWVIHPDNYHHDENGDLLLDEDGNPIPKG